ncbi:MAG TPA: glycosyltransferase family 39 protein [Planktothrix sp.]
MREWIQRNDSLISAGACTLACMFSLFVLNQIALAFFFWLTGVLFGARHFFRADPNRWQQLDFCKRDLIVIIGLVILFATPYLISPQVGSGLYSAEEGVMLNAAKQVSTGFDIFGLYANWWDFPYFDFWLPAQIAKLLFHSVTVDNLRIVEGMCGLVFIACSYLFLRLTLPWRAALLGAFLLGCDQVVLCYSRYGKWEVHIIATEVLALTALLISLKKSSKFWAYIGGVATGFSFMETPPAQAVLPLWLSFLCIRTLLARPGAAERKSLTILVVISLFGALQISLPTISQGLLSQGGKTYRWMRVLYGTEGLALEKQVLHTSSTEKAIETNIVRGLTCFNSNVGDTWGLLYRPDRKIGFLDPVSGMLLWVGIFVAVRQIKQKENVDFNLLAISSFTILWLVLALLINCAPVYGRLMVALPFIYYFVVLGIQFISARWSGKNPDVQNIIAFVCILSIASFNLYEVWMSATWNYANDQFSFFIRTVLEKKDRKPYAFYLMYFLDNPIDLGAQPGVLKDDMLLYLQPKQTVDVFAVNPNESLEPALTQITAPSFTLFITEAAWNKIGPRFKERYPGLKLTKILKDFSPSFQIDVDKGIDNAQHTEK